MSSEPQYYPAVFLAILIATLVSVVLLRRQRKQGSAVGAARATIVFAVATFTALGSLLSLVFVLRQAGLEPGKWWQQAIQIASAVIAYFVAGQALTRFRKQGS
jgi:putative flippase GtrA